MSTTGSPTDPAVPAQAPQPLGGPGGARAGGSAINDLSTLTGQLSLAFRRAMVATRKLRGRETQRPDQISYAQYALLFGLAEMQECSARELAERTDLSAATVTQMLEHLERTGLVKRTRSEHDRRVVLSVLSEHGANVVAERHAQLERRWLKALAEFSDEELGAAARVLSRLADYFDALLDDRSV